MGGDNGGKGRSVFRNNYKGHMDKTKEGVEAGEGGGMVGVWGSGGGVNADNCTSTTIK